MTPDFRAHLEAAIMTAVLKNTALRDSIRQPLNVGDLEPIYKEVKQMLEFAYEKGFRDGKEQQTLKSNT